MILPRSVHPLKTIFSGLTIYHVPDNKDIIIREFNIDKRIPACLVSVDGMVDNNIINHFLLPELMYTPVVDNFEGNCPLDFVERNVISINQVQRVRKYKEIIQQVLSGLTALFIEGCNECLIMESRGFEKRSVGPPSTETVVNGAHEGFTEAIRTNITLVRRIIKNEDLVTEFHFISKTNNFLCAVMYVEGITNPKIVEEVKRRIKSLDIDYISGSGMLEQLIEDKPGMIFPQVITTERPDRVASFLMDGKVAIICEGTPFALAMPITFFDLFHTSEESNLRHQYATFLRVIRIAGILIAALLPGMYTALILFHQEMIPTALLYSIVASRAAVPFPTIVEILLMEFSFELIREGGIRVPGVTGNTLGIIGALIMGQAAVSAGLVSPVLIIIVAVSGLGSFAIPNYSLSLAVRIVRFLFIIFGFIGGFYGISVCFTIIMALALGMKSFGVPFFSPVAPQTRSNKDKIIRGPLYQQNMRPDYLNPQDTRRMAEEPRGWTADYKGGGQGNE
jgi:spore germination protein KA